MDFINWWFSEHYIWSTLLTPFATFLWCCFMELGWRGALSFIIWLFYLGLGVVLKKK